MALREPSLLLDLLDRVLAEEPDAQLEALRRVGAAHPEHRDALIARFQALASFGLLEDADTLEPGRRIGPFELREEIGRGGMGVVYRAVDSALGREVALKVVRPELALAPRQRARFVREAEVVARFEHPNIVPVHSYGHDGDTAYLAMGLVQGITLAELIGGLRGDASGARLVAVIRDRVPGADAQALVDTLGDPSRPWPRLVASLLAPVADALALAHQRGVVHRDIKPSNVMIRADGRPVLLDFGLARSAGVASLTRSGAMLGSVPYMAPEQIRGEPVGPRADVFSMGAVLFELARLRPAFDARSAEAAMLEITTRDPLGLVSGSGSAAERDLTAILGQCLEKRAEDRYADGRRLRDDLVALASGQEVAARPLTRLRRVLRFSRREPRRAARIVTGTAAWILIAVMAGFWIGNRDVVEAGRARIEDAARESVLTAGYSAMMRGDVAGAREEFATFSSRWPEADADAERGAAILDGRFGRRDARPRRIRARVPDCAVLHVLRPAVAPRRTRSRCPRSLPRDHVVAATARDPRDRPRCCSRSGW